MNDQGVADEDEYPFDSFDIAWMQKPPYSIFKYSKVPRPPLKDAVGYVVDVKSTSLVPSPRQGQGLGLVKEGSSRVLSTGTGASTGPSGGSGGGYQGGVEVYVGTIIQIKEQENKVCVSYECETAPSTAGTALTPAQAALEGQGQGEVQDHEWLDYFSDDIAWMKLPDTLYQHSKVKR